MSIRIIHHPSFFITPWPSCISDRRPTLWRAADFFNVSVSWHDFAQLRCEATFDSIFAWEAVSGKLVWISYSWISLYTYHPWICDGYERSCTPLLHISITFDRMFLRTVVLGRLFWTVLSDIFYVYCTLAGLLFDGKKCVKHIFFENIRTLREVLYINYWTWSFSALRTWYRLELFLSWSLSRLRYNHLPAPWKLLKALASIFRSFNVTIDKIVGFVKSSKVNTIQLSFPSDEAANTSYLLFPSGQTERTDGKYWAPEISLSLSETLKDQQRSGSKEAMYLCSGASSPSRKA